MIMPVAPLSPVAALNQRYLDLSAEIAALNHEREITKGELQRACPHEAVAERPFVPAAGPRNFNHALRLCETCGVEEVGWNYSALATGKVRQVSMEEFYELRDLRGLKTDVKGDEPAQKVEAAA
jgi:hypothetical protein